MDKLSVVAAIPAYKSAESLSELLPQLAEQDYAGIYILDDASPDNGQSRQIVTDFDRSIHFVAGQENVGAGGNRNRIIQALASHGIDNTIIHFIDADMHLDSDRVPELAQEVIANNGIGFVGGLIKDRSGQQHPYNYGPRQSLYGDIGANYQARASEISKTDLDKARAFRIKHHKWLKDWPDPLNEPTARRIFWNAESNLLIRSNVFERFNFDPSLRDHEIQDLAIRLSLAGLERRFDPALAATHTEGKVRPGNRFLQMLKAEGQIALKHGLHNWILPDGKFQPKL